MSGADANTESKDDTLTISKSEWIDFAVVLGRGRSRHAGAGQTRRGISADRAPKLVASGDYPISIEQYRRLAAFCTRLRSTVGQGRHGGQRVLGRRQELTAANLALTLSESYRRRVLLVDADLRRPMLPTSFRFPTSRSVRRT